MLLCSGRHHTSAQGDRPAPARSAQRLPRASACRRGPPHGGADVWAGGLSEGGRAARPTRPRPARSVRISSRCRWSARPGSGRPRVIVMEADRPGAPGAPGVPRELPGM